MKILNELNEVTRVRGARRFSQVCTLPHPSVSGSLSVSRLLSTSNAQRTEDMQYYLTVGRICCIADVWWLNVVLPVDAQYFSAMVDLFFNNVH